MANSDEKDPISVGTVVRTYKWGDVCSGTVVRREGEALFVAWHDSFVESEMDVTEVEPWLDAPQALRDWRGGVGIWNPAAQSFSIEPVRGPGQVEPSL